MDIFDCAERYAKENVPLILLVGKDYGSGSSRDWAAKGPFLQGVLAVIAESYEREFCHFNCEGFVSKISSHLFFRNPSLEFGWNGDRAASIFGGTKC